MSVSKRGKVWHCAFMVTGQRVRESTRQTAKTAAEKYEAMRRVQIMRDGVLRKAPKLKDFKNEFFQWAEQMVKNGRLRQSTKRYYENGWARISGLPITEMTVDRIDRHAVETLQLGGSPAYVNQAVRTLRRMLGKAEEMGHIRRAPKLRLLNEPERETVISPEIEQRLMARSAPKMQLVLMLMQDAGLRRTETAGVSIERIDWQRRTYFVAEGKTPKSRRDVMLSDRLFEALFVYVGGRAKGWLFPNRTGTGHTCPDSLSHEFAKIRAAAGVPEDVVLYSARHTFGTEAFARTGDQKAVMKSMGHTDMRTAMRYQHPKLDGIRDAINQRNRESATNFATAQKA